MHLHRQLVRRHGSPTYVVGKGAKVRRLIERLFSLEADIDIVRAGARWVALISPGDHMDVSIAEDPGAPFELVAQRRGGEVIYDERATRR
jgi:hypothetical protein